jgi:hypothetical protein
MLIKLKNRAHRARIVYAGPVGLAGGEKLPGPGVASSVLLRQRPARPMGCRGLAGCTKSRVGARMGTSAEGDAGAPASRVERPMTARADCGRM